MFFYLTIALQAFCIYHLFKYRNEYYWVFIILFLPVLGSLIYLFIHVFNRRDTKVIQNEITTIINPTKKIKDIKKRLEFSETFKNRVDLAEAYMQIGDYENAIVHYEKSLKGNFQNDIHVAKQLIVCYSETKNYKKVIEHAKSIYDKTEFKRSRYQFLYGLALEHEGKLDEAEKNIKEIDLSFSNYGERLYLVKFLNRKGNTEEANEILEELYSESKHMRKEHKRKHKDVILEIEKLYQKI